MNYLDVWLNAIGGLILDWLRSLPTNVTASILDVQVWKSFVAVLVLGGLCQALGSWVAHRVGLLDPRAPVGERLGVGLGSGLVLLTCGWAALGSGGRSSFTPIAIGFLVVIALALARRTRPESTRLSRLETDPPRDLGDPSSTPPGLVVRPWLAAAAFLVFVGLLYGSTLAPSARDGVQPVEFMDEAYYSVLAEELAQTGVESIEHPSGFDELRDLPTQSWYHWGELWLAGLAIKTIELEPTFARYYVALPLCLLAAAALAGTLVRRVASSSSRGAFLFGATASLFLAPAPLLLGNFFGSWARGLIYEVTLYGMASVVVLLTLYIIATAGDERPLSWSVFAATVMATLVPAHIVIALLAVIGAGSVALLESFESLISSRRLPRVSPIWPRTFAATAVVTAITIAWAMATGHGLGATGASTTVSPFSASWLESIASTSLGAGVLFAIPIAWFVTRTGRTMGVRIYLGSSILIAAGAVLWGARLADFNAYHVFYGALVVFGAPVAAAATWSLWIHLRGAGRPHVAAIVVVLFVAQTTLGVATGIQRLWYFAPRQYPATATDLLAAIKELPGKAKLAYACDPVEEFAFWDPKLISIYAHAGRRVVPMCFEADVSSYLNGAELSVDVENPFFRWAPQRELYPDAAARPSSARVTAFLKAHGIDYIYADSAHPNTLVPGAIPIATSGGAQVLRVP